MRLSGNVGLLSGRSTLHWHGHALRGRGTAGHQLQLTGFLANTAGAAADGNKQIRLILLEVVSSSEHLSSGIVHSAADVVLQTKVVETAVDTHVGTITHVLVHTELIAGAAKGHAANSRILHATEQILFEGLSRVDRILNCGHKVRDGIITTKHLSDEGY